MATEDCWQNDLEGFPNKFIHLWHSEELTDCNFLVGEDQNKLTKFKCHKLILACSSSVFERMFFGYFKESQSPNEIPINDVNADDFRKFLRYVYTNSINARDCSIESLKNLVYMAKKYNVESLQRVIFEAMETNLKTYSSSDLLNAFDFSHLIDHDNLIDSICKEIKKRVMQSGSQRDDMITTPYIYSLSVCTFSKFVQVLKNTITEIIRFNLIETYIQMNAINMDEDCTDTTENSDNENTKEKVPEDGTAVSVSKDQVNGEVQIEGKGDEKQCNGEVKNEGLTKVFKGVEPDDGVKTKDKLSSEMIKELLELIDYNEMTAKDFCKYVGRSKYFDTTEKYNLLTEICGK